MSIYYCKNCKLLYRDSGLCECGRRLNTTSEEMTELYKERGFQFLDEKKQAVENPFDPKLVIEEYERERLAEEKARKEAQEEEQNRKLQEIAEKKRKAREEAEERRRRALEYETAITVPATAVTSHQSIVQPMDMNVAAFLAGLGLQRKN